MRIEFRQLLLSWVLAIVQEGMGLEDKGMLGNWIRRVVQCELEWGRSADTQVGWMVEFGGFQ